MEHIGLITSSYPNDIDGKDSAGGFVADFATELSKLTRVSVVAPSLADQVTKEGNLTVVRFKVPSLPLSVLKPSDPRNWLSIAKTLRAGHQATLKLVQENPPDWLFALWVLPCGEWARRVGKKHNIPYGVWALGSDIWSLGTTPVVKQVLIRTLRDAKLRFADGNLLCSDVEKLSSLDCQFLASARNLNVNSKSSHKREPPYNLAYLGRWHHNKGIDLLLDALLNLHDDDWAKIAEVRIFGGGNLEAIVKHECRQLTDAGRNVNVGGYVGKQDAIRLIQWADYLILPSRVESIPVIFSDSLQVGTPLIFTPVGDLPKLHSQSKAGVMANAISSNAISLAIREALQNSPANYAAGLGELAKGFEMPNIVSKFCDLVTPHTR